MNNACVSFIQLMHPILNLKANKEPCISDCLTIMEILESKGNKQWGSGFRVYGGKKMEHKNQCSIFIFETLSITVSSFTEGGLCFYTVPLLKQAFTTMSHSYTDGRVL